MPIRYAISDLRAKDVHNYPASNVQPLDYMPIGYAIFDLRAKDVHNYPASNMVTATFETRLLSELLLFHMISTAMQGGSLQSLPYYRPRLEA